MSGSQQLLLGGAPTVTPVDPYFYSVTSLLHGDGTNGGQNNTFLDSSSNNFTITRNGNTTQGSFSPFSQTGWSNYFDGSSLLTFSSSANYVPGSGEFCLECWFMPTATGTDRWLIGNRNNNYVPFAIVYTGSADPTALLFYMSSNGSTWDVINGSYAYGVTANQWNHLAFVRSGTSIIAYINGIRTTLATSSANFSTAQPFYVGGSPAAGDPEFIGYISNVRFVKGSTPYSGSTITVPTTPLTAITNTQLLTSQSNRFLDNSTNAVTPSITGTPSVQPFSPFNPTTAYSTSAVGGSGYFDGSGDYLSVADNAALEGFDDFTIEFWVYLNSTSDQVILTKGWDAVGTFSPYNINITSGNLVFTASYNGSSWAVLNQVIQSSIGTGRWYHIAVSRSGSTYRLFSNGSLTTTVTSSGTIWSNTAAVTIGVTSAATQPLNGYLCDLRIVKGTAVYTAAFTPPTAPLTAIANTSLLLNYTNGAIFDNAAVADYETVGNAQISTSVKKYGTGSLAFDGTNDYLATYAPSTQLMAFRTGDFTVEMWVYFTAIGTNVYHFYDSRPASTDGAYPTLRTNASAQIEYVANSAVRITGLTLTTNTWYHVALCRTASQTKLFVNGTQTGSTYADTTNYVNATARPLIGGSGFHVTTLGLNGYIDDLRISRFARYPYNFTPPTAEFPNIGGTVTLTADPYFDYTTLLLPGNGTNGAQNNTFLDSSTNAFSITRNGNTTQGTFSPFSQTGWGNYFDGNGDYLSIADSTAFTLGSGDFTVECWIYRQTSGSRTFIYGQSTGADNINSSITAEVTASNKLASYTCSGTTAFTATSASDIPSNQWVHVAIVRNGTTVTQYINGTKDGEVSVSTSSVNDSGQIFGIGSLGSYAGLYWNGYISNFRLVKGTAVYTSNFTPSTTPLTAITNTSLLTCQSNRFIDNSTNAFAITRNGDVSVQAFSPFNPTAAWSAATNGGSGYFDGSGDYLTVADNAALQMGSGDFTVEYWWYPNNITSYQNPIDKGYTGAGALLLQTGNGDGRIIVYASGSAVVTSSTAVAVNAWNHMALVRSGTTLTLYQNGVSVGSATNSTNFNNTATLGIGATATAPGGGSVGAWPIVGYLSNVRFVKGTAVYTANFTPPTAPLTAITNTSLLCNFTNAGIYDATSKNDLETVGNAQISTTQSKFGGSSMYFDGTGDYLLSNAATTNLYAFGTGDFTIEFWVYCNTTGATQAVYDGRPAGTNGDYVTIYRDSTNVFAFINNNIYRITGTTSIAANTWYHVAISRYSGNTKLFVNGVQDGSTYSDSTNYLPVSNRPVIGVGSGLGGLFFNGYIQDLRVTKGIARYTSNFTPPTSAFLTL